MSYTGRPYAGVSLLGGGRNRRGQSGPCKYRVIPCGECAWCNARRARRRAADQAVWDFLFRGRDVQLFFRLSMTLLGVWLVVLAGLVMYARAGR